MSLAEKILKPEYVFRPSQIFRRLVRSHRPQRATVRTPWGIPLHVRPNETVGHALWHLGVLDLPVSEVIARLVEPGETCVDVGANLGYMTALMAARAGQAGSVWAFEPHPEIFPDLEANAAQWRTQAAWMAPCQLHDLALSDRPGTATLFEPGLFAENRGTATLEATSSESGTANTGGREHPITIDAFDRLFPADRRVGVFKIDVEGHELSVFEGAERTLVEGRIRDIVFEEHHGYPSALTRLLAERGYTLFQISRTFWGPLLEAPEAPGQRPWWLPPNFLATRDPARAKSRCAATGWTVLRSRP